MRTNPVSAAPKNPLAAPKRSSAAELAIERGPAFRRVRDLLYRKYPQYPREAALSPADSVIVEVTPARVFTRGFD